MLFNGSKQPLLNLSAIFARSWQKNFDEIHRAACCVRGGIKRTRSINRALSRGEPQLLLLYQRLCHLKVMFQSRQGILCPVLQVVVVTALGITPKEIDGILMCIDLHRAET